MKTNLVCASIGLCLLGIVLMSATGQPKATAADQTQVAALRASLAAASPSIPFAFCYRLISCFTNGGDINMNQLGPEGQTTIWEKPPIWGEEQ